MGVRHSRTDNAKKKGFACDASPDPCIGNPLDVRSLESRAEEEPRSATAPQADVVDQACFALSQIVLAEEATEFEPKTEQARLGSLPQSQKEPSMVRSTNSASRVSSQSESRPRVTPKQAKAIIHRIFDPAPGELECIASGFLGREEYRVVGTFLPAFLHGEQREKWYLDAVMLAVLNKDRWRSTKQNDLINLTLAPNREQVRQLNQQRREYTNRLRELLLVASGATADPGARRRRTSLQTLLRTYRNFKAGETENAASPEPTRERRRGSAEGTSLSSMSYDLKPFPSDPAPTRAEGNAHLTRLRATVATSFECFKLLSKCVPAAALSTLPTDYFLNSTPILDDRIALKEQRVGDLAGRSFFVTLAERVDLLRGVVRRASDTAGSPSAPGPTSIDLPTPASPTTFTLPPAATPGTAGSGKGCISSPDELVMAMKHLGLILTTACSSMVLHVLFELAEVIHVRRCFRAISQDAASRGVCVEGVVGGVSGSLKSYVGSPATTEQQWRQLVVHDEMSLSVYTRLLLQRYREVHAGSMDKLRRTYSNLFDYFEALAPEEERAAADVTRLLAGIVLKLMYLIGGGQRSIEADDRHVALAGPHVTDDVLISRMLEVPVLSRICWVACMMGMPVMTLYATAKQDRGVKPLTFAEADECAGVMRELFQAVGALPWGSRCPRRFTEWLALFPLYAVDTEGKRILLYIYTAQSSAIRPLSLSLQKDMVLLSFAEALKRSAGFGRADIGSYLFQPHFTVGYRATEDDAAATAASPRSSESSSSKPRHGRGGLAAAWDRARPPQDGELNGMSDSVTAADVASDGPERVGEGPRRGAEHAPRRARLTTSDEDDVVSTCTTTSAHSSESALMHEDCDIDVYTCVSRQNQLYLRCSNEATVKRHRLTELTPFVTVDVLNSTKSLLKLHPEMAHRVLATVPALLPGERLLRLRWNKGEPCVTMCVGDCLPVTLERVSVGGGGARYFHQPTTTEEGAAKVVPGSRPRRATRCSVVFAADPAAPQETDASGRPRTAQDTACSTTPEASAGGGVTGPRSVPRATAAQSDVNAVLGVKESTEQRFGARWTILQILPLLSSGSPGEVVLHVTSPDLMTKDQLQVASIGHERSSMSPFRFLGSKDNVCWANPHLLLPILCNSAEGEAAAAAGLDQARRRSAVRTASTDGLAAVLPLPPRTADACGALCDTRAKLHDVFYALGVLLSNAIANGVFLSIPFAPLFFYLMKRALATGDYTFTNFMWLEPSDGNLLSSMAVLTAAYGVLTLSDTEYIQFLHSRGLARPRDLVFPVLHSLAAEGGAACGEGSTSTVVGAARAEMESLSMSATPFKALPMVQCRGSCPSSQALTTGPSDGRADGGSRAEKTLAACSGDAAGLTGTVPGARTTPSSQSYLAAIHRHNLSGNMFRGGATALVEERVEPARRAATPSRGEDGDDDTEASWTAEVAPGLRERLPSREEYITLYLVNEIAWSSVQKDGKGGQTKDLWVSMGRGLMTSPLAKSPLFTHCCSRIIREVLCVPPK